MCSGAWQRAGARGEEKGGALSCVGGLFRLGFGKLLHEHVENPKPLSSSVLPGDECAPSVVDGACGQDAASSSLFSLLFTLLPQPSSFPHSCLLACAPLPRIFTPMFRLFTSCCVVHAQGVCFFPCVYVWLTDHEVRVRMYENVCT